MQIYMSEQIGEPQARSTYRDMMSASVLIVMREKGKARQGLLLI